MALENVQKFDFSQKPSEGFGIGFIWLWGAGGGGSFPWTGAQLASAVFSLNSSKIETSKTDLCDIVTTHNDD